MVLSGKLIRANRLQAIQIDILLPVKHFRIQGRKLTMQFAQSAPDLVKVTDY